MRVIALLFLFFAVALPAQARPITHEDVWLFRRLGTPAVSPDGQWVVLPVTEPAYDKAEQVSDLWLVPSDGSQPPRRLTSTPGSEGGVQWSAQGDKIVFTAKRGKDKVRQLYILGMTGPGEAQRVTDFPLACANPRFTPDGESLVFESLVHAGSPTTVEGQKEALTLKKERKEKVSAYEGFPIRYWDHWLDGRHPRPYLLKLNSQEPPRDLLARWDKVELSGFAGVPGLSGESLQHTVSPDGKSLLFVAALNRDKAVKESTTYRLYSVPLEGGAVAEVPAPNGSVFSPTFGPDGRLYTGYEEHTDYVYNLSRVRVQAWPARDQGEILSPEFDRSVAQFVVGQDGVTVCVPEHGRYRLYRLGSQQATPWNPESRGVYNGLAQGGDTLVARYEDGSTPAELVRISDDGTSKPLSAFNLSRTEGIDWSPFREFWFSSEKGRKIHNWVVLPPNFQETEKYPMVLFIHGGPHSTSLDKGHVRWSPQLLASQGYVVLLTDYTGSVGYGVDFARAIQGDPLKTPGEELLQATEEAIQRYPFVLADRVAASGASYGGHMANWLQATTDRYRCLIGHAGLISLEGQWSTSDAVYHREVNNGGLPWESDIWKTQSPSSYVSNFKTPMLLTIGEKDYRVPLNQTLAAWTYLQRMGVPSKLLVYHQANHWIMSGPDARHFWREVHDWLGKHLKS